MSTPGRPRRHPIAVCAAWLVVVDLLLLVGALACDVVGGWLLGGLLAAGLLVAGVLLVALLVNHGFGPFDGEGKPLEPQVTLLACTLIFGPLLAPLADEGLALWWRGHQDGVPVAEVAAHTSRALIGLEATLRADLVGTHEVTVLRGERTREREVSTRYVAAPLVGPGWTPSDPVPAWLVGVDADLAWGAADGVVEVVRAGDYRWATEGWCPRDRFAQAAAAALAAHGLRAPADAPLLQAVGALPDERAARLGWLGAVVLGLDVAVLLLVVAGARRARLG